MNQDVTSEMDFDTIKGKRNSIVVATQMLQPKPSSLPHPSSGSRLPNTSIKPTTPNVYSITITGIPVFNACKTRTQQPLGCPLGRGTCRSSRTSNAPQLGHRITLHPRRPYVESRRVSLPQLHQSLVSPSSFDIAPSAVAYLLDSAQSSLLLLLPPPVPHHHLTGSIPLITTSPSAVMITSAGGTDCKSSIV